MTWVGDADPMAMSKDEWRRHISRAVLVPILVRTALCTFGNARPNAREPTRAARRLIFSLSLYCFSPPTPLPLGSILRLDWASSQLNQTGNLTRAERDYAQLAIPATATSRHVSASGIISAFTGRPTRPCLIRLLPRLCSLNNSYSRLHGLFARPAPLHISKLYRPRRAVRFVRPIITLVGDYSSFVSKLHSLPSSDSVTGATPRASRPAHPPRRPWRAARRA